MWNVNSSCKSSCQMLSEQQPAGWTRASTGPSLCGLTDWLAGTISHTVWPAPPVPLPGSRTFKRLSSLPWLHSWDWKSNPNAPPHKSGSAASWNSFLLDVYQSWELPFWPPKIVSWVTLFINPWHWIHNRSWACFWLVPVMTMVTFLSKTSYHHCSHFSIDDVAPVLLYSNR